MPHTTWLTVGRDRIGAEMSTKKHNHLTLQKKYKLVKKTKSDPSLGIRKLAEIFDCGKTQVSTILHNKDTIIELYESNTSSERHRSLKRARPSQFSEVNDLLYNWYLLAVQKNVYPDGSRLCRKAKDIASHLGQPDFKASNGWLEKWKSDTI